MMGQCESQFPDMQISPLAASNLRFNAKEFDFNRSPATVKQSNRMIHGNTKVHCSVGRTCINTGFRRIARFRMVK